ncbi:Lrp/AsnC family transcriptional regulator [Streptomyces sp. NPDC057555]|uniref:Lrp/AsnC family transcriptional regulator n=1 Tax=Streptomyces sp. NPDC057555 TaxID=3346166 RepID=UPI003682064D
MTIDVLDLKIIHALSLDGRASFRSLAKALEVSPQTVQRRYARLRSSSSLRVLGRTYPEAVGDEQWFLRLKCAPGATDDVASALARHEETDWIHLTSGGTEIVCTTRNPEDVESALLRNLPRTPRVTSLVAQCLLHTYYGGPQNPMVDKTSPLSTRQIEQLRFPTASPAPATLTRTDQALLKVLHVDGRAENQELARAAGCSASTAHRRVTELRRHGVLYFDLDYDPRLVNRSKAVMLWASVAPRALEDAGRALAEHKEVSFATSTTGPTNLYAALTSPNSRSLHTYLTGPLAALPGLTHVETAPVTRTVKSAGTLRR